MCVSINVEVTYCPVCYIILNPDSRWKLKDWGDIEFCSKNCAREAVEINEMEMTHNGYDRIYF
ncbi:hypothetical protein [Scytonema sp. NUACC26]|uniref:hypothetical protein n=1 Tax=Scytonema sp. NUACC26 TaxID=3140176 RepID=UPI0034DC2014